MFDKENGAPGEIRTPDLQLRRLPLYPSELRARFGLVSVHRGSGTINLVRPRTGACLSPRRLTSFASRDTIVGQTF
jgi:hypothetical protein